MTYIKGDDRNQMCLPQYIEDMISEENPVRVIDIFVDSLDLKSLGFLKSKPAHTGRPAYDPKDLLKLYIYGYFNKIRSSRKLMQESRRNIELFFLLNRLAPDFRTISDFRKENAGAIRNVFLEFTKLCLSLDLYSHEFLAIDGSKFRALNGNKKMYNDEILKSKIARIDAKINEYMANMDKNDMQEAADENESEDHIPTIAQKINELEKRKKLYKEYIKELKKTGTKQKLITDPQARMMHSHKDGFHCCYNVQTAVDSNTHIIADYMVTNHVNDQNIMHDFSEQIKKTIDQPVITIVADKGYDSKEEILDCIMDGTIPYVGFKDDKGQRLYTIDYQHAEITEAQRTSNNAEDIRRCLHAGVLPYCYEHSNISLELKNIGEIGIFSRGSDSDFVICPMGFRIHKVKDKNLGIVYKSKTVCRQCKNRCTASTRAKEVYFGPKTKYVAVRMYGNMPTVNIPPNGFIPNNSFFKKEPIRKTVLIQIQDDVSKQKQRLCISEHPFGTIKWYHAAHYLLCKGITKATAELGLSFLAYNLRRAINVKGVPEILAKLGV